MSQRRSTIIRSTALLSVVLLVAAGLSSGSLLASAAGSNADEELLAAIAAQEGVPVGDLTLLTRSDRSLEITGVTARRAKALDERTGAVYGIAVDASNEPIDLEAAQAAELEAYRAENGTMTTDLAQEVDAAAPSETIPVGFWLEADAARLVTRAPLTATSSAREIEAAEQHQAEVERQVMAAFATVNEAFARELQAQGIEVLYISTTSPSVYAMVPAGQISDLSTTEGVISTSFAGDVLTPSQDIAKATTAATKVFNKGITGASPNVADRNVGVVECCDSLFTGANNYWLARYGNGRATACGGTHNHPTAVMGIILSTHQKFTGHAYNGNGFFNSACDGSEAAVNAAIDSVVTNVNGPINHSYGVATTAVEPCPAVGTFLSTVKKLDDAVRNFADSQYVAAGNDGNANCVEAPGNGWNITTVGAFDDKGTTAWTGDTMAGFSNGGDPAGDSGDRSKPEVAGPGVNFTGLLPTAGGNTTGNIGSGTSYATPVYAGGGALAAERKSFLRGFPETEKAVMLTSSCHNIEGGLATGELDGAGAPDFLEADVLLNANRFRGDTVANGSGVAFSQSITSVTAGQRIRAAIAWDTNTSYSLYATDPSDDLDLVLKNPSGAVVASSASFDNTFEVIDFATTVSGTYTLEVNRFRTSDPAGSTFVGTAWHKFASSVCTAP